MGVGKIRGERLSRGVSRDDKRCIRSFVGKHEWIYTVKASIYERWRPGGLKVLKYIKTDNNRAVALVSCRH